jgi:heat shock protein HslJ
MVQGNPLHLLVRKSRNQTTFDTRIMKGIPMRLFLLACLTVVFVLGCQTSGGSGRRASPFGEWVLVAMSGGDRVDSDDRPLMLSILPDGQVAGFSGVNRFSGRANGGGLAKGRFDLGPLAVTRMAGPPEAMRLETLYLTLLNAADAWRFDGRMLVLTGPGGVELRFEAGADQVG